ncbi:hypothetical protein [Solibacillus sp. CAU 1738]|uniref:hypothetical protein n=1 Tax=Solibacillus sp. CAU 1738 TaxID=3140363 RepID=UPI003260365F
MSYDVQIGRLISGRREAEGRGIFLLCNTDQTIREISTFTPHEGIFVSRNDIENALYDFCKSAICNYIEEESNEDVYTFSICTDSYHSSYLVYINDQASLEEIAADYLLRKLSRKLLENG